MRLSLVVLCAMTLVGCAQLTTPSTASKTTATSAKETLSIVPYPQSVKQTQGTLTVSGAVQLSSARGMDNAVRAMHALLARLNIKTQAQAATQVTLQFTDDAALGTEGYKLDIGQGITISANTGTGLFYGVQTLRQLLPVKPTASYQLPHVAIVDAPTYTWRGSSLDVARSFLPIAYIKKHINRMALFKLNRLHLHLTDDQGWRIEIKGYPKLTQIGGASAVKGGRSGYYTQKQLKALVAYAKARGVTIVPEVDMPGHMQAAIASYNDLACDGVTNLAPYSGIKVGFSILCPRKPKVVWPFVRDVLRQVVAIFPSHYIHIGGDEIKDPDYAAFVAHATRIVHDLGRTAVVWEEGSVAQSNPSVLIQLWNDDYPIAKAVKRGHSLILSPCSYLYIDHANYPDQPGAANWCTSAITLKHVYRFNPQQFKAAVGVEATTWSEFIHTNAVADNRLWPRLAAVAEVAWTPRDKRHYASFVQRLGSMQPRFDALGIHYYVGPDLGW